MRKNINKAPSFKNTYAKKERKEIEAVNILTSVKLCKLELIFDQFWPKQTHKQYEFELDVVLRIVLTKCH